MTALLITVLILVLSALGAPVYALLGFLALFLFHAADLPLSAVIVEMQRLTTMPSLIAVPLFTFAGYLLAESGAPRRLVNLAQAIFGWLPGSMAVVGLVTCALFTAFTGASGVTIIALGGLLYPMLRDQGYPEKFTLGLLTTTGSLGLLFPPSLPIILYGIVGKVEIDKLFAACALPGLLLMVLLGIYTLIVGWRAGVPRIPFSTKSLATATREAIWEVPLPFLVIGGIYGGWFTAGEASAVMAMYVLVVEVLIYRDIKPAALVGVVIRSMTLVGSILVVLGTALGLMNYVIDAEIPSRLFDWLHQYASSKIQFLIILNAFLLVVNMVEIFSAIFIVVPIIVPVAKQYGIDPIHLGALFLLNLEIGYMTPPMGLNLFLSSSRFNKPLTQLYSATLPFWFLLILSLLVVTYVPQVSLLLVHR
ncbi:MAG: TRAP transporter large permease subunit [bacterium]